MKQEEMKLKVTISQDGLERLAMFLLTGKRELLKP